MTIPSARAAGLVGCVRCGAASERETARCPRCGAQLISRAPLEPVIAWLVAGVLLYIPANLWPMLVTRTLGREEASTIIGGVIDLAAHGAWGIAAIVAIASIGIPLAKFAAIILLALIVHRDIRTDGHRTLMLYEVVEFIGRWSMIDIFVVAILSALVQLGFVVSLAPGPAAVCFALSVAFTMLAARAFDPRLIWDRVEEAG